MEPEPRNHLKPDGDLDRFFEKRLRSPIKYLRGLGSEPVEVVGAGSPGEKGEALEAPDNEAAAQKAAVEPAAARQEAASPVADGVLGAAMTAEQDVEAALRGPDVATPPSIVRRLARRLGFAPQLDIAAAASASSTHSAVGGVRSPGPVSEDRYTVEGEIGAGGMGRVLNVYDQDLRRRVAMKILRPDSRGKRAIARFFEEAQATGQLEHPNIAPVYDIGLDREYGLYFTMKLVRGRNLREVVRDLSIGRPETRRHFTVVRLVQILQQVAMGIQYAHARGVIHRDLKPDNVMVGDFGEVLVMDWGLAKILDRRFDSSFDEPVGSHRQDAGDLTIDGTISGTPGYMAPEQARGWVEDIDARTDVFGLGAILYELLTYRPLYEGGTAREVLARAVACEVIPPRVRAPRNAIPRVLEEVCLRALAREKEVRFTSARELHEALQVFLDGTLEAERRREEALRLARHGRERARDYRRLAEEEAGVEAEAAEELSLLEPHDTVDRKASAWRLEDRIAELRRGRLHAFSEATSLLHSAINVDPGCHPAMDVLADLYASRLLEAEASGNTDDQVIYRGLVERYHRGRLAHLLEDKGRLGIEGGPGEVEVHVSALVERGRRLVPREEIFVGKTPIELELPRGHHLVLLRKPGHREARYPILLDRSERVVIKAQLLREDSLPPGCIHVPAGDFVMGGDSVASGARLATRRYVPDFLLGELPVTFEEYCRFLDGLAEAGDARLADLIPRTEKEGALVRRGASGLYEPDTERLDIDPATRARHAFGFERRLPVFGVSWFAAKAYTDWLSGQLGLEVRLPRDVEWEKAARGAGRLLYPWGNRFDWSFLKGGLSRAERAQPEPVGAFAGDVSLLGVRDLVGCIIEWCEDWFLEGQYRVTRGGGWYSINEAAFRAALRLGTNPANRSSVIGFRIAIEAPRPDGRWRESEGERERGAERRSEGGPGSGPAPGANP